MFSSSTAGQQVEEHAHEDLRQLHLHSSKDKKWWAPSPQSVQTIYKGTPPGAAMRRLLVDFYTGFGKEHWLKNMETMPDEFLPGLAFELLAKRQLPGDPPGHQLKKDDELTNMKLEEAKTTRTML